MIIIAFRLAGKRHISQLSLIDFALILLVSNAVQNAMVGSDSSLNGGIAAALTLIGINIILTRWVFKDEAIGRLFEGEPRLLVRNGQAVTSNMVKENIRITELEEAVREHGIATIKEVKTAILELDGSISIIPFDQNSSGQEVHIPPHPHRRRGRRGIRPNG